MLNALQFQPKPSMKRFQSCVCERERERSHVMEQHIKIHENFSGQFLTEKMQIPNIFSADVTS